MGVLSTHPVDFLDFFQETEITTSVSDDVGCHELQLVCHCGVGHCEVEDEDAACGFHRICSTAIQFCDRHGNRSFLLLRIADFVVDTVDVVDVSVSEIVAFPPGEHLAFSGIVLTANSGRCRRGFWAHQHSNEESNVWRSVTVQLV